MESRRNRSDYFKERRKGQKTFSVTVDKEKLERFEQFLRLNQKTKASWLNEKIDEELEQKK